MIDSEFVRLCKIVMEKDTEALMCFDVKENKTYVYAGDGHTFWDGPYIIENTNEVIGKYLYEHYYGEDIDQFVADNEISAIAKLMQNREEYTVQYQLQNDEDRVFTKLATYHWVDSDKTKLCFTRRDITESIEKEQKKLKVVNEALKIAEQATEAKTEFLTSMSYDIRTPMNAIIGMTDMALDDIDNKIQIQESLSIIKNASNQLLELVNDILDMSRIESGKLNKDLESIDIDDQIKSLKTTIMPLVLEKNQHFAVNNNILHNKFIGESANINRILSNILGNAVKYTNEAGNISFEITEEYRGGNYTTICYKISDNGVGLTKEHIEHIFEPFYMATDAGRQQGTGLGLSIVKKIADFIGASIEVESEIGKGSTFTVYIPLRIADEQDKKDNQESILDFSIEGMNILLAEDHPINQKVSSKILEKYGAKVTIAENGKRAVELFEASKPHTYQAILMDIQMPIMDGYEATKCIRSSMHPEAKTMPIIAVTANAFMDDIKNSLEAGMNSHISKPFRVNELMSELAANVSPRRKMLVVDDVKLSIAVIRACFEDEYDIYEASGAIEALEILKENKDIKVLITDIQIPVMNGVDLIRKVRETNQDIIILANTQYGEPDQEIEILKAGADDFIYKPSAPELIRKRTDNLCKIRR